ncbi:MAG: hypothetical protein ACYDAE_28755, partial [Steroidobacteraceae bacterium]
CWVDIMARLLTVKVQAGGAAECSSARGLPQRLAWTGPLLPAGDGRGIPPRHSRQRQALPDGSKMAKIHWIPKTRHTIAKDHDFVFTQYPKR